MKTGLIILSLVLGLNALAASSADELKQASKPDANGFIHLFNGENLEGWKIQGNPAGFTVVDGILRSEGERGGNWMYWEKSEFDDFELQVEWRLSEKGNSGVFIRVPTRGNPWTTGYEVQISSEQPPRDALHCTGSLYGYCAVDPRPDETPGVWRTFIIRAEGGKISVACDGKTVLDYEQSQSPNTRNKPLRGFIGIQDAHAGAGTWVEFRAIKIRPLTRAGQAGQK
jgi:hypothetical protein